MSEDFSNGKRGPVLPQEPGKQRITIRLDEEVLDWFRAQVRGGGNYQTLINQALKSHIRVSETRDPFTYRVTWSAEDGEYVGLCAEFPSLSWLAATPEAALKGIRKVVAQEEDAQDVRAIEEFERKLAAGEEERIPAEIVHLTTPRRTPSRGRPTAAPSSSRTVGSSGRAGPGSTKRR